MANINIFVTDTRSGECVKYIESEEMGVAMQELLIFGAKRVEQHESIMFLDWTLSDYTKPKSKGSLFQLYGRFTRKGSPSIKGVGTKL